MLRVRDVIQKAARQVGGSGNSSVDCDPEARAEALDAINSATDILMQENPDALGTTAEVELCVDDGCFILEEEFETIIQARLNDRARTVRSDGFKYLDPGPGAITGCECQAIEAIDDGWPVHRQPNDLTRVAVYSERPEREGEVLYVEGMDARGGFVSEEIPIRHGNVSSVCSASLFRTITGLRKGVTMGRVFVHAWDPANPQNFPWITTLNTWTRSPSHRRYRIAGACPAYPVHLRARVALRYHLVNGDDDVLLIQNGPALELMVQAIAHRDRGDIGQYLAFKNTAVSLLKKQSTRAHGVEKFAVNLPVAQGPTRGRRYDQWRW